MHCGYVVKVENLRPHPNADRLQIATFFGNDTVISIDTHVGDVGIYFPSDLQLSEEYCLHNNLVRKKDAEGNNVGGFLDPDKRNIKPLKLRGEKSDGLYMPIESLAYCYDIDLAAKEGKEVEPLAKRIPLNIGEQITMINSHEICCKYIPVKQVRQGSYSEGNRTRKKKVPTAPLFAEHADTEQLAYNLAAFKPGDEIEITLKMHGTSQRTGYLPTLKGYKRTLWDIITRREGKPIYDWGYVSGTRRVVLENYEGGFYGDNQFREQHSKAFEGKLNKGETVYYEVIGFTTNGAPIMGNANNKKLNDKDFVKQYGEETVFSYGCSPVGIITNEEGDYVSIPQSDIYVYRMTLTNEDGFVVEYTPDFMRYRCEQMGVKTVPVFWKETIPDEETLNKLAFIPDDNGEFTEWIPTSAGEYIKDIAEQYYDGPDPVGKTHIREGVVVRIINRPKFCAYKHKNWYFKALEGLVKVEAETPDMEEAESLLEIDS